MIPWRPAALLMLLAMPSTAAAERWTAIETLPGATPVSVLVNGKPRVYFRLTEDHPLTVAVSGPAEVRITTRVELPAGAAGERAYGLTVSAGARTLAQLSTQASAADRVSLPSAGASPGRSRALHFDLPSGGHELRLAASGGLPVLVRIQTSGAAERNLVSLTPVSASRSVAVVEGEKTIPYYTVLPNRPVELRVIGPTTLEVLTRLDYDSSMRGSQSYSVRLVEGTRTLAESSFTTSKATTASYADLRDRVPSKFDRMRVAVRDGTHHISVELIRPVHGSAEIHARIPQPSVGVQE